MSRIGYGFQQKGLGLRDAYRTFDTMINGQLDYAELLSAINFLGIKAKPKSVRRLFKEIDQDRDGEMSYDEFEAIFKLYSGAHDQMEEREEARKSEASDGLSAKEKARLLAEYKKVV